MATRLQDKVVKIISDAKELPAEERAPYVLQICGQDKKLADACLSQLMIGTRISAYRVVRELGRGGMGSVFLAHRDDGVLDMTVCIKLTRPDVLHPQFQERFRRERQILADLKHPHIATLLDAGNTDANQPYFIMEYIEGETIDDWNIRNKPSLYDLLQVIRKVAVALDFAHGAGVIHRDIKPHNVMMDRSGEPKLLDFGIAHKQKPRKVSLKTASRSPMTPAYASPEQHMGQGLTEGSDVYSLGIVLLELLAGNHPLKMGVLPMEAVSLLMAKGRGFADTGRLKRSTGDSSSQGHDNPDDQTSLEDFRSTIDSPKAYLAVRVPASEITSCIRPDFPDAENDPSQPSLKPLPEGLGYVLRRMLDPHPEKRYLTAEKLITGLDQVLPSLNRAESIAPEKTHDALFWHDCQDTGTVQVLAGALEQQAKLKIQRPHLALDTWASGEWEKAIPRTRSCIVCLGPKTPSGGGAPWRHDPAMRDLLGYHNASLDFIPLLLPGADLPEKQSDLPAFLRGLAWIRLNNTDETEVQRLASRIKGKHAQYLDQARPTGLCPFRGLEFFREEDAHLFFGRESLIQRITSYLTDHSFGAILGPSGSGKSSMMQAGVIPWLREQNYEILLFTPNRRPLEELAFALRELFLGESLDLPTEYWSNRLKGSAEALHYISCEFLEFNPEKNMCLVIDQFEELFTLTEDRAERASFIEVLCQAIDRPSANVKVLLTMRSDFLGKCSAYPDLNNFVIEHGIQVPVMNRGELVRAIELPANLAGLKLEPGLLNQILNDIAGSPGKLPLLGHALLELYERHQEGVLTQKAYGEIGGIEGALAKRAESEYSMLDTLDRKVLRRMFALCLVHPGEGTEDSRRRATKDELITVGGASVEPLLERWIASRLLTETRDETRDRDIIDVAHEALIRRWERIGQWMAEDRETARLIHRLRQYAATWNAAGRDENHLLQGGHLFQMKELVERQAAHLGETEIAFVNEGAARAEQELLAKEATIIRLRRRRNQAFAASAIAILCAFYAFVQRARIIQERDAVERERFTAERVTAFMLSMFDHVDPDLARGGEISAFEVMENGRHQIDKSLANEPEVQVRLTATMGRVYRKLGHHTISRELLEEAAAQPSAQMAGEHQAEWELIRTMEAQGDFNGVKHRLEILANRQSVQNSPLQIGRLEHARGRLWHRLGNYVSAGKAYERAAVHLPKTPDTLDERLDLIGDRAELQSAQGFFDQAVADLQDLLTLQENHHGKEHSEVAATYATLGIQYRQKGHYDQAERCFSQSEEIYGKLFGVRHPHQIGCFVRRGNLYKAKGDYRAAEPYFRQALALARDLLGENHLEVANCLNYLAAILRRKGDLAAAEPLYRHSLAMRMELLGDAHPDVAQSLNNLALLLSSKGDSAAAEPLLRRALSINIKLKGKNHPNIATSLNNLALLDMAQGNYSTAESHIREALSIRKKLLGESHFKVAGSLNSLARLHSYQGDYPAAESLHRQALDLYRKTLGDKHIRFLRCLKDMGRHFYLAGDLEQAETFYRQALADSEALPSVKLNLKISIRVGLARVCLRQNKSDTEKDEVTSLLDQAHDSARKLKNPLKLASVVQERANWLRQSQDPQGAKLLLDQSLAQLRQILGNRHPLVAAHLFDLAEVTVALRRPAQAIALIEEATTIYAKILPAEHEYFQVAASIKGRALADLYRLDEARPLLQNAHETLIGRLGESHYFTQDAKRRLTRIGPN